MEVLRLDHLGKQEFYWIGTPVEALVSTEEPLV